MQYLRLFFSAGPIASSSQQNQFPGVTTTRRFTTFSKLFYLHLIGSYPIFNHPYIDGQDPTEMSGFLPLHFPTVPF